jgi:ubiquinone/menaquinone biosynthesis C-methylase UbiE
MSEFSDWMPAPNIRDSQALYELENQALDPDGIVLEAMRNVAPWAGRSLIDLGCGTGFWLPRYAAEAATVIGIEPDPELRAAAIARSEALANASALAGSAEHLPLPDASVDVVHARFAYFFGAGSEAGLQEVMRVLRVGGTLVVVDNDYAHGEFADLLHAATQGNAAFDPAATAHWWRDRGARRVDVMSQWRFKHESDLAAVLRNEFRDGSADAWLDTHPGRASLTYSFALFALSRGSDDNGTPAQR